MNTRYTIERRANNCKHVTLDLQSELKASKKILQLNHARKRSTMTSIKKLKHDYPWIQTPLIVGAPMRLIALADLAVAISKAGTIHAAHPLPHLTTQQHNHPLFSSLTPKLTPHRRHRLHRHRHRRVRSRIAPGRGILPARKRKSAHRQRHAPRRCGLHQLGRRPRRCAARDC